MTETKPSRFVGRDAFAIRTPAGSALSSPLRFGGLVLDLEACTLARESGERIALTHGELSLLRFFVARPGRVLSRDTLLGALGDRRFEPFDRSVDVLVGKLRRRVENDPKLPKLIVTVRGEGYRFDGLVNADQTEAKSLRSCVSAPSTDDSPRRLSMVVLPFANMGGSEEHEYFVDGVTESLTTDLSRIRGSFIIGRSTAFTYKGKAVDLRRIGRDLNVRYVLEGSIQRSGNRMRVNVQLIDSESDSHLWAERFDKPVSDLFDLQDEIVARLAAAVNTELITAEARRAERSSTPDSVDFCFRAQALMNKGFTWENLAEARSLFERALILDSSNVRALTGVASVDVTVAIAFVPKNRGEMLARAEDATARALSLAPEYAPAHFGLGIVQTWTARAAKGIQEFRRALELDRNLVHAHAQTGLAKVAVGQPDEAEIHVLEALRLSPRDTSAHVWCTIAGVAKLYLGKGREGEAWLRRAVETNPNDPTPHFFLASALSNMGRFSEASSEAQRGLTLNPAYTLTRARAGALSDNPVHVSANERFIDGLRLAGIPE